MCFVFIERLMCICPFFLNFVLQSYSDFLEHVKPPEVGQQPSSLNDSLWGAFVQAFYQHINDATAGDSSRTSVAESPRAVATQPLNTHALGRTIRASSFMRATSELSRAPNSAVVDSETVKSNLMLLNTWKPDGEKCYMQTLTVKRDAHAESDVKVYWNTMLPPGAFYLNVYTGCSRSHCISRV
jgi:hypothetical protein